MQDFLAQLAAQRRAEMQARAAAARAVRTARLLAPARGIRRLARQITAVIAECNAAQRRLTVLNTSINRYEPAPNRAPDTYSEFLARTAGPLRREPTAASRVTGRSVR